MYYAWAGLKNTATLIFIIFRSFTGNETAGGEFVFLITSTRRIPVSSAESWNRYFVPGLIAIQWRNGPRNDTPQRPSPRSKTRADSIAPSNRAKYESGQVIRKKRHSESSTGEN